MTHLKIDYISLSGEFVYYMCILLLLLRISWLLYGFYFMAKMSSVSSIVSSIYLLAQGCTNSTLHLFPPLFQIPYAVRYPLFFLPKIYSKKMVAENYLQ